MSEFALGYRLAYVDPIERRMTVKPDLNGRFRLKSFLLLTKSSSRIVTTAAIKQ
jgi:hypothetical protein